MRSTSASLLAGAAALLGICGPLEARTTGAAEQAAGWDALTRRIGLDAQRAAYLDWTDKPNAYPR